MTTISLGKLRYLINVFPTISQVNFRAKIRTQLAWIYRVVNMFFWLTREDLISVHVDERDTRKIQTRRSITHPVYTNERAPQL